MDILTMNLALLARRMDESSGGGGMGFFLVLAVIGIVVFLVLRGRRDRAEALDTPVRAMGSGPLGGHTFANPFPKCPACGTAGDKMRQSWDGLRKVTWTCGYCGSVAGIQELKDEELPPGARQRLGLDQAQAQGMAPGQPGYYPPQGGGMGGVGGVLTGMMLGSMLGGGRRERGDDGGWTGGGDNPGAGHDWGENDPGGGDSGGDGGGGDWGDSGGGDSGGGGDF
ncbi:MAG: hypothetical protein P4L36_09125 [Holophaga sp.]|nr:hypothetical protein [Holophaga sp.]